MRVRITSVERACARQNKKQRSNVILVYIIKGGVEGERREKTGVIKVCVRACAQRGEEWRGEIILYIVHRSVYVLGRREQLKGYDATFDHFFMSMVIARQ